jgi:hypothetical protein
MHHLTNSQDIMRASQRMSSHFPMDADWLAHLKPPSVPCVDGLCTFWNTFASLGPIATFAQTVGSMCGFLYFNYFVRQLASVYFLTPVLVGEIGGWGGKTLPQICGDLTKVEASFWEEHVSQCSELVEKRFIGILALVETILIIFCAYRAIQGAITMIMGMWKLCWFALTYCCTIVPRLVCSVICTCRRRVVQLPLRALDPARHLLNSDATTRTMDTMTTTTLN